MTTIVKSIYRNGVAVKWAGVTVKSARDVATTFNDRLVDDIELADAPAWGNAATQRRAAKLRTTATVWSWDNDGAVVGGDGGLYGDKLVFRTWAWLEFRGVKKQLKKRA